MRDLSVGKESKLIFRFAMPMLLGNVFQQLYNIIDSIIIGNYLGKEALGAVGASFPLIFALMSFIIGIATGSTIVIAQYFGSKDLKNVKKAIDTLYIFLFFASIIISIIGIIFSYEIFRLIDLPENIIPQAVLYFNIFISGAILFFGFNGTSAILRGLGDSVTPLIFLIISTIINILLDLLFVIVLKWGISGVAIATIISQGFAFTAVILYLNKYHKLIKFSFLKLKFDRNIFHKSLRIGLPTGFQNTFVSLGMLAMFKIVNMFGTDTIAAYSVAMRINSFVVMPAMNFANALAVFVGQNLGANKPKRIKNGLKATFFMTSVISVSVTIIAIFFGRYIMGAFISDINVIEIGYQYLIIVGSFYVIFSTMFVINGVMRGAGATLVPMFITLIALWIVRIPVSYFLSLDIGVTGIWWGIPIAWAVGMILSFIYYLSGRWKTKVVVKY